MRIKVLPIDLEDSVTSIGGLDGYTFLKGIVRLRGTLLGAVDLPVINGRCSAQSISDAVLKQLDGAIIRHLLVDALAVSPDPDGIDPLHIVDTIDRDGPFAEPFITVAVCTRDRPDDLRLCLDALARLDYANFEVIVVDNAPSSDATQRLVTSLFPDVRYTREPRPGLDWARNRAIVESRGEIVAYTDDDVIVDSGWLRGIATAFSDPVVMAATGLVAPFELETEAQQLFERYGGFGRGFERKWFGQTALNDPHQVSFLGAGQFGTGANMAYRRELFDTIGLFDPALDVGTVTNGGGDLEMFFRVLKYGHVLAYEPSALVFHRHRREYDRLKTQLTNNGIGFYSHLVRSALAHPDERTAALRLGLWWLWWWNARRLMKSYVRPGHFPRDLIVAEFKGSFVGLTRYQRARRNARRLARAASVYGPVASLPSRGRKIRPPQKRTEQRIAVRTVDVANPLRTIEDIANYDAVRLIVTRGERPIGDMLIPSFGKPVSPLRLREALARNVTAALFSGNHSVNSWDRWLEARQTVEQRLMNVDRLDDEHLSLPVDVSVSVVVATCDRPDDLHACLTSLVAQQTRRSVEIIVVDNRPGTGLTPAIVAQFPGVRLVEERVAGLSYARNAGISASSGEIIIATDDDVTMPPNWLETLVTPFARADVAIVTGNVLPLELDTHAQQLFEQYGGLGRGYVKIEADRNWFASYRRRAAPTWILGATANAAFRASIFADPEIGMIDETLGAGSPTGCSEDTYVFYKVLRAGLTIVYEPNAFVWHRHRRDMEALRSQIYNYSKGHVAYHLTTAINDGDLRGFYDIFLRLPHWRYKQVKSYVKRTLTGRDRYPLSLVVAETAGNVAAPYALWKSRKRVKRFGRSQQYVAPDGRVAEHDDIIIERDPVAAN